MKTMVQRSRGLFGPRKGQAMLEYVLVFVALLAVVLAAMAFARAPRRAAEHAVDVVCSENL